MFPTEFGPAPPCRSVVVPTCDPLNDPSATILAVASFVLGFRDKVDFTLDFGQWITANGSPNMSAAVFSVASGSPSTPTIVGQASSTQGKATVVLSVPVGGKVGDAYYLDVTADFDAVAAHSASEVAIPARRIVRRVNIVVVPG